MIQGGRIALVLRRSLVGRAAAGNPLAALKPRGLAAPMQAPAAFRSLNVHAKKAVPLEKPEPQPGKNSGEVCETKHDMVHFRMTPNVHPLGIDKVADRQLSPDEVGKYGHRGVPHPIWSQDEVNSVEQTHVEPKTLSDRIALRAVKVARWSFDTFSLYRFGKITRNKVLNRAIFLETVAAVPGMAGGMLRHLRSLRPHTGKSLLCWTTEVLKRMLALF